ncbi:glycosyl hydrolase family 18 protein [Paenibacillus harenae]|uniref:glycosyl hydrolase family 18 protein n=1 Tax=Paenibacillus harenae TaxID=306543 RepID=UPI0027928439|nr:glycosyl hydrolase family 18 protein [Paenibacillus harenae]MDQ0058067.1 spore germination protein YaaH [Paenibacillus harenae]
MVKKKLIAAITMLLLTGSLLASNSGGSIAEASASLVTKYRVYQNDQALREFPTESKAIAYAKNVNYSHVETIAGRTWVWDNLPRYKVYKNGISTSAWEYRTYEQALAFAKTQRNVHIRDMENIGWKYANHAKFKVYQGDKTQPIWTFTTIEAAIREAKKWGNAHIIDITKNAWVWDNLTAAQKKKQRAATAVYQITVDGVPANNGKLYGFLYDAIISSSAISGSEVVNTATGQTLHSNILAYEVKQNGSLIGAYVNLDAAVAHAKMAPYAEVVYKGNVWWSGVPYLTVYQNDRGLRSFNTRASAIDFAKKYANATVRTSDGRSLWSNAKSLVYMAWNGSATSSTVLSHVANTQGLTIDSPTWFELTAADGSMQDTSDAELVNAFKEQGILVAPLVHNQFNRKMTTAFLKDKAAQETFITKLVGRLTEIKAYGVNLDFEEVAGADRAAYTAFVAALAKAAHAKGLNVSIDLPRGSLSWNHLTAYDHAALSAIVDTIVIMAYDEHWSGSDTPGSVAGLPWVEEGIKQFLGYGIPRSKLILGIPFYVREWKLDAAGKLVDNRAVLMKDVPSLIADNKASGVHDLASGQTKYKYVKDGFTYLFWAETAETTKSRIALATKYDLAGVAAWRLGYESADLWTMMLRMK